METMVAARWARRSAVLLFIAACGATFGVSGASALPGLGRAARLPVHGPSVSLGCANPLSGAVQCFGRAIRPAKQDGPEVMAGPTGLGPAQIQSAYKLTGLNASGRTVAIVDAYDDPNAASDLNTFRQAYGLPPCTTDNGCFKKVNQNGATSPLPSGDYGWAEEESLDVDAVSSACPTCHILLVEASSASTSALSKAENSAAKAAGVAAISNSYGGSEASSETSSDSAYNHPGIAITVSSGDGGYGVEYPAASRDVTAVGGTTLTQGSNSRGWTEAAWSGAGSGCSAYEAKPTWQKDTGCAKRTVADVSADAAHRVGVRAGGQHRLHHVRQLPLQPYELAVRRDQRVERELWRLVPVHRRSGLRRPDRSGHAERHGRLLNGVDTDTGLAPLWAGPVLLDSGR